LAPWAYRAPRFNSLQEPPNFSHRPDPSELGLIGRLTVNKSQGLIAGTVLAVALLLRPFGSTAPGRSDTSNVSGTATRVQPEGTPVTPRSGPWLASCSYWAPVRPPVDRSAVSRENDPVESNPVARAIRDSYTPLVDRGCGGDSSQRWGFPADGPPSHGVAVRNRINGPVRYDPRINVTAVIATVPDPRHAIRPRARRAFAGRG